MISFNNVVFPVPGGPLTEKISLGFSLAILTAICCIKDKLNFEGHLPYGKTLGLYHLRI